MDGALRQLIVRRAAGRCEYCHLPQAGHDQLFSVDHVIAKQHGGDDSAENLALCCLRCNLHKGPNLSGIHPVDSTMVRLFSPRTDVWADHFGWVGAVVAGRTPVGRATVAVLVMNAAERVRLRESLLLEGLFTVD